MNARYARFGGVLLTVALATTACGGDDEKKKDAPASGSTVSTEVRSYQDEVADVCGPAMKKIRRLVEGVDVTTSTKAEKDAAFAKIGQGFLDEVKALKKVDVPDEIAEEVAQWLDSLGKAARAVKTQGTALLAGDTPPFADADARAQALGVLGCLTTAS